MSGMITRAAAARAFSTEALKVVNNVAKQQFSVSLRGSKLKVNSLNFKDYSVLTKYLNRFTSLFQ